MLIKNGKIVTMAGDIWEHGYVRIKDKKILSCGDMTDCPCDEKEAIDAKGGWVLPGFVDIHTHLGLFEDGLGFEGEDGNEDSDPTTPQLRALDGINPADDSFKESLLAGVTTVLVSPGSTNLIGGQIVAMKTYGRRVDDMIVRAPIAMKMALGENPKSVYNGKNQTPVTRMAMASIIRNELFEAREYMQRQENAKEDADIDIPDFNAKHEALLPVLKREIPIHVHAHRTDDIFTAIRIAKEFSLEYVIVHATEAHLISDILKEENSKLVVGPFLTDRSKPELKNMTSSAPAKLWKEGLKCAITTDHPETPLRYLLDCAVEAVKQGMNEMDALAAITVEGARIAGLLDRVGSIEPSKDADVVIFSENPFSYNAKIQAVIAEGTIIQEVKA